MMHLIGQPDNSVPMNIGIQIPGQAVPPNEPVKLILTGGSGGKSQPPGEVQSGPSPDGDSFVERNEGPKLILPEPAEDRQVVDADGEPTSTMTWPYFCERRRFSCKPRTIDRVRYNDLLAEEGYDPTDEFWLSEYVRTEQADEVIQATTEFIGEAGELAEMVGQHGIKVLWGELRKKLIDECGDILFTGAWLIEAWATNPLPVPETEEDDPPKISHILDERPIKNPLLHATGTELYLFEAEDIHANLAVVIINNGGMKLMKNRQFVGMCSQLLMADVLHLMTYASLTANAAKKLAFQRREQDAQLQIDRVIGAFQAVNFILCLANSSIEEAMIVNRKKIDARYPNGYSPGVGGGIRTEG